MGGIYFHYLFVLLMASAMMQPTELIFHPCSRNPARCHLALGRGRWGPGLGPISQWQPHDFTTMLRCFLRMTLLLLS